MTNKDHTEDILDCLSPLSRHLSATQTQVSYVEVGFLNIFLLYFEKHNCHKKQQ